MGLVKSGAAHLLIRRPEPPWQQVEKIQRLILMTKSTSRDHAATSIASRMAESGVDFGTSGARGLVSAMTDRVCFAYVLGFLQHLAGAGEFAPGGRVAVAGDLRPSTPRIVRACVAAIRFAGGVPVYCGEVPAPALCYFAYTEGVPSLMVTGSHIAEDRNGIKFNRCRGEFLKSDEAGERARALVRRCGRAHRAGRPAGGDRCVRSVCAPLPGFLREWGTRAVASGGL
jgi:phosphomannomutase